MTAFLIKRFIKEYEKTGDPAVRAAYAGFSGAVGIICNSFLFALKLFIGIVTGSAAVIADSVNNLTDSFTNIVTIIGAKISVKPADREHPFGHGRIEYITGFIMSVAVISVGINFFRDSVDAIIHPRTLNFSLVPFLLLIGSIGVKLWMSFFYKKIALRINSELLKAQSADSLGDVLTTSVTAVSLLVSAFSRFSADGYMGAVVSCFIIRTGITIAKNTLAPLIGTKMDRELYDRIVSVIDGTDGILKSHDLIIHSYGSGISFATIHAEMPGNMTLEAAHRIADLAEKKVREELGVSLVIHLDPVDLSDNHKKIRASVERELKEIIEKTDPAIAYHDLQIIFGKNPEAAFDLVIPFSFNEEQSAELLIKIEEKLTEEFPGFVFSINMDRNLMD
jgi:cation diffusion facilitator family transporter